ncbi:MAG: DUF86 domain-containing protein [Ruminococcaceae bacterium]|nr:DUF86 domain-containing protein [Oscillospiraceae bacterium]
MIRYNERDMELIGIILRFCDEIDLAIKMFGKSFEVFENNNVFRNAVSMPLMQTGEYSNKLSDEFKASHPEIPWTVIRGMRNWFAHGYFDMDITKIWEAAVDDIPALKKFCEEVLDEQQIKN